MINRMEKENKSTKKINKYKEEIKEWQINDIKYLVDLRLKISCAWMKHWTEKAYRL